MVPFDEIIAGYYVDLLWEFNCVNSAICIRALARRCRVIHCSAILSMYEPKNEEVHRILAGAAS